jgi:hypothetical protein
MACEKCGNERARSMVIHGRELWCRACHEAAREVLPGSKSAGVIPDDIPGGVDIAHGLCNEDGSPRRYYSKSEIAREASRRGLVNIVEHVCEPGTDKAKYTTRWI